MALSWVGPCFMLLFVPGQELNSSLVDRDRAICERNELLEKYCHEVKDKAEAQKELSQACKDIEMVREERDVARKERTEAIIQRDQLLREYYQARQVMMHRSAIKPLKASVDVFMVYYFSYLVHYFCHSLWITFYESHSLLGLPSTYPAYLGTHPSCV